MVLRVTGGGKGAIGRTLQEQGRRARRRPAASIRVEGSSDKLTRSAGLVRLRSFVEKLGLAARLNRDFGDLKVGPAVVYSVPFSLQVVLDLCLLGEERIYGIEHLAVDPLLEHLHGDAVPSLSTLYRDLERLDSERIRRLEAIVVEQGLAELRDRRPREVHLDIDSTVLELFGAQEGAVPGPNPVYRGRPSYHPLLARVEELDTVVAAELRHGNTGIGAAEVPFIQRAIRNVRAAVGASCIIHVRIDAAADCAEILKALDDEKVLYVIKGRLTSDAKEALQVVRKWEPLDDDKAEPTEEVAELEFQRGTWKKLGVSPRVVALRSRCRQGSGQRDLFVDPDLKGFVWLTNDREAQIAELAKRYDLRAGIEPLIGELKYGFGIGKVSSSSFDANHVFFLLKLLAHNLVRRYTRAVHPEFAKMRVPWLRRLLLAIPGRLVKRARRVTLRVPSSMPLFAAATPS